MSFGVVGWWGSGVGAVGFCGWERFEVSKARFEVSGKRGISEGSAIDGRELVENA